MLIQFLKEKSKKILKKTERFTKTDMIYLARGSFWLFSGQGIGSLSSLVVVMFLANMLPKDSFGQYRYFLSIISILSITALPGIGQAVIRSISRGDRLNLPKIAKTKIYWGFIGSFIALLMAMYYWFSGNTQMISALILSAFCLPFTEAFTVYSSYYKGRYDFKTPSIYESISRIFQAIVIIFIVLISKNIIIILGAFFAGQIIARFFFYKKTLKDKKLQIIEGNDMDSKSEDVVKYGKHLSLTYVVSTITGNIDKLLVGHFLGVEVLAIYFIALTIPRNIVLLFSMIPKIAFPKFSKNSWNDNERAKVVRKMLLLFALLIVPALIYALLVPFIIPIIFKSYSASISTAIVLAFLCNICAINAIIAQILQARKFVKQIIVLQVITLIIFILVFLVVNKGLDSSAMSPAIALVVSDLIALFIGLFFVNKKPHI